MIRLNDLYTYVTYPALANQDNSVFGEIVIQYEVRQYSDVRNIQSKNSYIVTCTQRLIIPNSTEFYTQPNINQYCAYPALATISIMLFSSSGGLPNLIDYSPKTINTSVNTDQVAMTGGSITNTQQSTTGSSTSQTNSYGGSASIGITGDMPSAGLSGNYENSSTNSNYSGSSSGSAVSTNNQLSNSSEMSVKNWGGYAQLDTGCSMPTWIWGQEYPWNMIQFRNATIGKDNPVNLPEYVLNRLYEGTQAFPPSELSLFGVNFVSKAAWLITPEAVPGGVFINASHVLSYSTATHGFNKDGAFGASMSSEPAITIEIPSNTIDLELYALDPIRSSDAPGAGVIGFVPSKFVVAPAGVQDPFKITSDSNNVHIRGTGFADVMSTTFPGGTPVSMTVYFKIVDTDNDVTLNLKHWTTGAPCLMTITVNGSTITKHVDAAEGEGGESNTTSILLRYKDFSSINYCDFILLGLNVLTIGVKPSADAPSGAAGYTLSALAIG